MKKNISRLLIIFFLAQVAHFAQAQDSSRLRLSLLTCTPGEELYSTFGHSALRVIDSNSVSDIVFNYGTFDFNDNDFYVKFVRGKLMYFLSWSSFEDFKWEYQTDNRGITEQVLDLTAEEKIDIKNAIRENTKEENRYYKYDFFLDNCTTRLRDIIVKHKRIAPILPPVMPENFRFRQAIHQYLDQNKKYWSKLGIDILLGARCDNVMTTAQQEFLPDNLMIAFDSTKNTKMVLSSKNLYDINTANESAGWFTPALCFSLLLILYVVLGFFKQKIMRTILFVLDGLLFFAVGLLGILLLFMWFGTDHSMTKDNYNLLWAWPTHIAATFFLRGKKSWMKKYFLITSIGMILVLAVWFFLPQQLNTALIPVTLLLFYRAFARSRN